MRDEISSLLNLCILYNTAILNINIENIYVYIC